MFLLKAHVWNQFQCPVLCMSNKTFLLFKELILELATQFICQQWQIITEYFKFLFWSWHLKEWENWCCPSKILKLWLGNHFVFHFAYFGFFLLKRLFPYTSNPCFNIAWWPFVPLKDILFSTVSTFYACFPWLFNTPLQNISLFLIFS